MNAMLELTRRECHRPRLPVNPPQNAGKTDTESLDVVFSALKGRMDTAEVTKAVKGMGNQSVRDRLHKLADAGRVQKLIAHNGKVHWERV